MDTIISEFDLETLTRAEIFHIFNHITGSSQNLKTTRIPVSQFNSLEEADEKYFIPRGGRCAAVITYYEGTVDPAMDKWLKTGKIPKFLNKEKG